MDFDIHNYIKFINRTVLTEIIQCPLCLIIQQTIYIWKKKQREFYVLTVYLNLDIHTNIYNILENMAIYLIQKYSKKI